jgi:hypothetical protein
MRCCGLRGNKKEFVITKTTVKATMRIKVYPVGDNTISNGAYKADLRFSTSAKYFLGAFKTLTSIVS